MTASAKRALPWAIASVFQAYLTGVAAFSRDFAKLGVTLVGIPLFVGEATIGILAVLLAARTLKGRALPFPIDGVGKALAAYFAIGTGFALFGLARHYGVAAVRDFALVYYLAFFFFTLAVVRLGTQPRTIIHAIAFGSVVGALVAVASYAIAPSLTFEHGAPGYQAPAAWIGALWCCLLLPEAKRATSRALLGAGATLTLMTIYLTGYRTMLPVMIVSLVVLWVWAIRGGGEDRRMWRVGAWVASGAVGVFMLGIATHTLTMTAPDHPVPVNGRVEFSDGLKVLSSRWVRGFKLLAPTVIQVIREGQDKAAVEDSLTFRLDAWGKAFDSIKASPLTGIGFGPAPALYPELFCDAPYSPTSNCGNAHNTFITLAMRMGIPVFLLFSGINLAILAKFLRSGLRASSSMWPAVVPPFLAATYVSLLLYAGMSLFFESPYLSPLYWIVLGLMHVGSSSPAGSQDGPLRTEEDPRVGETPTPGGRLTSTSQFGQRSWRPFILDIRFLIPGCQGLKKISSPKRGHWTPFRTPDRGRPRPRWLAPNAGLPRSAIGVFE